MRFIERSLLCLRNPFVIQINLVSLAVVKNVLLQCIDLLDPDILFPNGSQQTISAVHRRLYSLLQFFIAVNVVLLKEKKCLGCLFQVVFPRPLFIACVFAQRE